MLYKAFSFLSLILIGDVVNCQRYVSFTTGMNILYKQEKLPFTCNPTGVAAQTGLITDIILWKNSTLGWKEIVKIWSNSINGVLVNEIEWLNTDIRDRAAINKQKVSPSNEAGLEIEISLINVKCSDSGVYKCSINGNSRSVSFGSESAPKTVKMTAEPASINPIQVQPQQPDNKYNPYTSVTLTCSGDVGNPPSNLRWCIRTTGSNMMGDFTVYGNTNDITHGTPTLSDCQYRQQSVLTYNVSATIQQADFRCETGGTSTTCGHSSAIAANYTVYLYAKPANTDDQGGPDTSNAGVIAGAVIGSFVGIVLIIIIIYFVAFRKKNTGETYRTKEENGTGNTPIDNTIYNVPHKERDRNSSRDRSRHYENKGMDEPHTRGYLPDMDPRGRSNRGMDRSIDDVRDNHVMSSRGPIMGSNASFGSAV